MLKIALFLVFLSLSLQGSSLEEKVGQLLIVHFNGKTVNEDARVLVQKLHVGGIIYYNWANGLTCPEQVLALSKDLQKLAKIPLFIAVDQEGGAVNRLSDGFTVFPGNRALANARSLILAQDCSYAMGQQLRAVGVNLNLSPVVDINSNPRNPVIGLRSFGETSDIVIPFAKKCIEGYHKAEMLTSLKHFPGHGDVAVDSHADFPILKKSKQQLDEIELLPFKELAAYADSIMTAHVMIPSIDPKNCATLSKPILDLLRHEMSFEGVLLSDSLVMEGLLKNCSSIEDAAIQAVNAGCDMLILGGKQLIGEHVGFELTVEDVQKIHSALVAAVKNGVISHARLEEAVQRILKLKKKYPLLPSAEIINAIEHQQLAKKIADAALKISKNKELSYGSLTLGTIAVFVPQTLSSAIEQTSLLHLGKKTECLFFNHEKPTSDEIQNACKMAEKAHFLIFCSFNAWQNSEQAALFQALSHLGKPTIVFCLKDPLDADIFSHADLIVTTYSPTSVSIQAACDTLSKLAAEDIQKLGEKIWKNECRRAHELTHWNKGENFASLGIGHFIWYPSHKKEGFEETFPALLNFMQTRGIKLPHSLQAATGCPWGTREEFYENIDSPQMVVLRQFLQDTTEMQTRFMMSRLESAASDMVEQSDIFYQLACDAKGLYALIDYLNFKGAGTSCSERYNNEGWGLLQVLQSISLPCENINNAFAEAARAVLCKRVENSPPERNEKKWLPGWLKRVDSYR